MVELIHFNQVQSIKPVVWFLGTGGEHPSCCWCCQEIFRVMRENFVDKILFKLMKSWSLKRFGPIFIGKVEIQCIPGQLCMKSSRIGSSFNKISFFSFSPSQQILQKPVFQRNIEKQRARQLESELFLLVLGKNESSTWPSCKATESELLNNTFKDQALP